ncbi:MAG: hypothetical protein IPM55_16455 [Acidobacteria bacterium]|nr:hypothetical protein [Acidobacteriota bacterium]
MHSISFAQALVGTGTNGKTTTPILIGSVIEAAFPKGRGARRSRTIAYRIGNDLM